MYDFRTEGIGQDLEGRPDLPKPSLVLTAGEAFRVPGEFAGSLLLDTFADRRVARLADPNLGQGRPVLVIPGFHASDLMTKRLRSHLSQRGWDAYGWGVGTNHGLTDEVLDGALARLDEVYGDHQQPVSLIGWSFGGLLARWLAQERPEWVRQVITLGSPWRPEGEKTRTTRMFERSRRAHGLSERAESVIDQLREPLLVHSTAIYSKTDGIVPWRGCALEDKDGPAVENISVPSSHMGLVMNPLSLAVVTDRLAQDPAAPEPFSWRRMLGGTLRKAS
ncbi:esterase/lipase family protein [Nocardioides sp.]|uniref:esterase/lipase family protein n=1 Tax=Nocardioides sp. TaxID=35761 RepID=UPI0035626934